MTMTGTLERPTIDLASEEGSRTPGEIAAQLVGSTNADTALTLLSADLLGVTGRAIGLDAFRVERGNYEHRLPPIPGRSERRRSTTPTRRPG